MSKFSDLVKDSDLRLVLPSPGKMMFVPITSADDVALCFTYGFGFVESSSPEVCAMIRAYLQSSKAKSADIVGNMDKVVKYGEVTVYRQRIKFANILTVLKIFSEFDCCIELGTDFKITEEHYAKIGGAVPILEKYRERCHKGMQLNEWLTSCCVAYMYLLCQVFDLPFDTEIGLPIDHLEGLFMRAPYLCGYFSPEVPELSSVILFKPDQTRMRVNRKNYALAGNRGYLYKDKGKTGVVIYGYTRKNLRNDIRTRFINI